MASWWMKVAAMHDCFTSPIGYRRLRPVISALNARTGRSAVSPRSRRLERQQRFGCSVSNWAAIADISYSTPTTQALQPVAKSGRRRRLACQFLIRSAAQAHDGLSTRIKFARDSGNRMTLRKPLARSFFLRRAEGTRTAQHLAFVARSREASGSTLQKQIALKFGNRRQHRHSHLPGRAREVCPTQREAMNADAHRRQLLDGRTDIHGVAA
ncbi:hypothetical protein OKW37_001064 [Paraburkholderia sp. MM5482-R2]